ncbi:hypothetical protein N431DRAFT_414288 [Stipitochalara longipes BDJ]|nr:hypothetical protein N431DRAFT_414288 [Stipitochalara longipes BDJ]
MNTSNGPAKLGPWTDYATGEKWLVLTATWGYVLLAALGVWLTFSTKFIMQILANFALWVQTRYDQNLVPQTTPSELTLLLPESRAEAREQAKALARIFKNEDSIRDLAQELCLNEELSRRYRIYLCLFIALSSTLMIGFIILSVFAATIENGPAKLDSEKCGLWLFDKNLAGEEAATRAGLYDLEKETRAGTYAQNCYGVPDMFDAIRCSFLYQSSLPFGPVRYTDCPFQSEICGQHQTITFATDFIDANALGINSESAPKFRRNTTCTPLSMEHPFIRNQTINGTTTFFYYYGGKPEHDFEVDYTYTTTGDPFDHHVPAYEVQLYTATNEVNAGNYWEPRPELTYPEFSTLTLIFVSSQRIYYRKGSEDPIFPADEPIPLRGEKTPWFRNSDPRARPLACIDQVEVCSGDGKACWFFDEPIPKDDSNETIKLPPEFWLMYIALRKTNVYNAIIKRLGRALIAQSKVSVFFSQPLGDYHWVDEVERWVATLHAMTQINSWSTASGEDSIHEGKDGYTLITDPDEFGNLCDKFKFRPQGYASLLSVPFWFIVFSLPTFWVLSRKWSSIRWIGNSIKGVFRRSKEVGRTSEPMETQGASQEQAVPEPTISAASDSETRETSAEAEGVAGPSGSTTTNVRLDSDQEGLQLPRPSRRRVATGGTRSVATIEDSIEIKWEPMVIGKLIKGLYIVLIWVWRLLDLVLWRWPVKAFGWLKHTRLGLWVGGVLGSLSLEWLSRFFNSVGHWWRECTHLGEADVAEPA